MTTRIPWRLRLPRPLPPWCTDLPRQLAVIGAGAAAYLLNYLLLTYLFDAAGWQRLAVEHARQVLDLERALRIANEPELFRLAQEHRLIGLLANGAYLWLHLPLIVIVAIWLFGRYRPTFVLLRDAMIAAGLIALVCEYYPVAPPYLVPELGMRNLAASGLYDVVEPKGAFVVYGAVPSIHVGWALLMGLALWWHAPRPYGQVAGALLPLAMAFGVVATGNHYQFDSLTGVAAALLGLWFALWRRAFVANRKARQAVPEAPAAEAATATPPTSDYFMADSAEE
jgi:hypothetical protein